MTNTTPAIRTAYIDILAPGFLEDWTPAIESALEAKHPGARIVAPPRAVGGGKVRNPSTGHDADVLEVEVKWIPA